MGQLVRVVDFVVVGSGIAGSALAKALAGAGRSVLVLERDVEYRDRVRGENMAPWGVLEAKALDVDTILVEAGGHYARRLTAYDEVFAHAEAELSTLKTERLFRDCPGFLDVGHPEACAALSQAAEQAGATVLRGVQGLRVQAGASPHVSFVHAGAEHDVACGLIVGADGRQSTVREQMGLALRQTEIRTVAAGLLVHEAHEWPADTMTACTEADRYVLVTPRANGVVRLYILWTAADRTRFAGRDGPRRFLDAFRLRSLPRGEALASAEPAGPCATFPMNDAILEEPVVDGAVLMGDAAGWNDPIIGQGLSIALRDARLLRDLLLNGTRRPSRDALMPYVEERRERLRRLRYVARAMTDMRCTFTPEGAARRRRWFQAIVTDPLIRAAALTPVVGPDAMPAAAFTEEAYARTLAL